MKCSVRLLTDRVYDIDEYVSSEAVGSISQAAEGAGFDSVSVTDHPMPAEWYVTNQGHHALDPFVALSFAAAATSTIRVYTNIIVVPYRNPFVAAKSVASLDVLSKGRLILGVAAGYLKDEFDALGADFDDRNEVTDEHLRAMKVAWAENNVTFKGRHFYAEGVSQLPKPAQQPHPPIWVGGNSKRAARRAAEFGVGVIPLFNPANMSARRRTPALESRDDLKAYVDYAQDAASKAGRPPLEVVIGTGGLETFGTPAFDLDAWLKDTREAKEAGVTYLNLGFPAESRAHYIENLQRFGEEAMGFVREL